jgi:hypothetical protein
MLIKNIRILNEIIDIEDDSIDVCVDSEDGYTYTVSISTTKNILQRMDQEKSNFSNPANLVIVVRKLTEEIITEALEAYAEDDAFWLKLHQFATEIDISVFDELKVKHVKELIESNLLSGLDDLENEINKFDNLNNAQKSNLIARIEKLAKLLD